MEIKIRNVRLTTYFRFKLAEVNVFNVTTLSLKSIYQQEIVRTWLRGPKIKYLTKKKMIRQDTLYSIMCSTWEILESILEHANLRKTFDYHLSSTDYTIIIDKK